MPGLCSRHTKPRTWLKVRSTSAMVSKIARGEEVAGERFSLARGRRSNGPLKLDSHGASAPSGPRPATDPMTYVDVGGGGGGWRGWLRRWRPLRGLATSASVVAVGSATAPPPLAPQPFIASPPNARRRTHLDTVGSRAKRWCDNGLAGRSWVQERSFASAVISVSLPRVDPGERSPRRAGRRVRTWRRPRRSGRRRRRTGG